MSFPPPTLTSLLVDLPDPVLWSSRTWPEFAELHKPERHLVVLPLFGFADWGLGRSLDLEETIGTGVVRSMLATDHFAASEITLLPPMRFLLGPYPHTLFGIDFETALDLVREIAQSVHAAGLRRLVFFNTSPWNEEFADTCACDLRAELGLQTYCVHLASLGLDLHPARSSTRTAAQTAACALTRHLPLHDAPRGDSRLPHFRPGDHRQPAPLPYRKSLDAAVAEGWTILADAGTRLAALLLEMRNQPALANGGVVPKVAPPAHKPRRVPAKRRK